MAVDKVPSYHKYFTELAMGGKIRRGMDSNACGREDPLTSFRISFQQTIDG